MSRLSTVVALSVLAAGWAAPVAAAENAAVAAEIIALVRQQWDAEIAGKPAPEQAAVMADDYTEFGEDYPVLFSGKALMERYNAAPSLTKTVYSEMLNPKVQVYGDTAVLTYNYLGYLREPDGKMSQILSNASRVYVRQRGRWMLIHAHFSRSATPR